MLQVLENQAPAELKPEYNEARLRKRRVAHVIVGLAFSVWAMRSFVAMLKFFVLYDIIFFVIKLLAAIYFLLFGFGVIKTNKKRKGTSIICKVLLVFILMLIAVYPAIMATAVHPGHVPIYAYKNYVKEGYVIGTFFPDELPPSAENAEFIYCNGFMQAKGGYSLFFNADSDCIESYVRLAEDLTNVRKYSTDGLGDEDYQYYDADEYRERIREYLFDRSLLPETVKNNPESYIVYRYDSYHGTEDIYIDKTHNAVCILSDHEYS